MIAMDCKKKNGLVIPTFLLALLIIIPNALAVYNCTDDYYLNSDETLPQLECNITEKDAYGVFIINASGITLDCNQSTFNLTLYNRSTYFIHNIDFFDDTVIKNCVVTGAQYDFYSEHGNNWTIANNTLSPLSVGISLSSDMNNSMIEGNIIDGAFTCPNGIYVGSSTNATIIGNEVNRTIMLAISAYDSSYVYAENNSVNHSLGKGINFHYCSNCFATGNTIMNTTSEGISSLYSSHITYVDNWMNDTGGLTFTRSSYGVFINNTALYTKMYSVSFPPYILGGHGMLASRSINFDAHDNTIRFSNDSGIGGFNLTNSIIYGNTLENNSVKGLGTNLWVNSTIYNNDIYNNSGGSHETCWADYFPNGTVRSVDCFSDTGTGIVVRDSTTLINVFGNDIRDNHNGTSFISSVASFENNTYSNYGYGFTIIDSNLTVYNTSLSSFYIDAGNITDNTNDVTIVIYGGSSVNVTNHTVIKMFNDESIWIDDGTGNVTYELLNLLTDTQFDLFDNSVKFDTKTSDSQGTLNFSLVLGSLHEIKVSESVANTPPKWSNKATYPASPTTYAPVKSYWFNVTWIDPETSIDTVLFELALESDEAESVAFSGSFNDSREKMVDGNWLTCVKAEGTSIIYENYTVVQGSQAVLTSKIGDGDGYGIDCIIEGGMGGKILDLNGALENKTAMIPEDCLWGPVLIIETTLFNQTIYCESKIDWYNNYTMWSWVQGDTVGAWHLDEGTDSIANDSTANNNDGTISGATWVPGKYGNALEFDGSNDYVDLGNGTSLDWDKDMTFSAWIKTPDTGTYRDIMSKCKQWGNEYCSYQVRVESNGKVNLLHGWHDGTYCVDYLASSTSIDDDQWHHVSITRNNTDNNTVIYIDGYYDSSGTVDCEYYYHKKPHEFGRLFSNYYFNGTLDEVQVFSRVLSDKEIYEIYSHEYSHILNNLPAGDYTWKSYANDTTGLLNETDEYVYDIQKAINQVNLYLNGNIDQNLTVSYGTQTTALGTSAGGTALLFRDGASVTNPEITTLSASTYTYFVNATGNINYLDNSTGVTFSLLVTPLPTLLQQFPLLGIIIVILPFFILLTVSRAEIDPKSFIELMVALAVIVSFIGVLIGIIAV